jgi:hypothetical protein
MDWVANFPAEEFAQPLWRDAHGEYDAAAGFSAAAGFHALNPNNPQEMDWVVGKL